MFCKTGVQSNSDWNLSHICLQFAIYNTIFIHYPWKRYTATTGLATVQYVFRTVLFFFVPWILRKDDFLLHAYILSVCIMYGNFHLWLGTDNVHVVSCDTIFPNTWKKSRNSWNSSLPRKYLNVTWIINIKISVYTYSRKLIPSSYQ